MTTVFYYPFASSNFAYKIVLRRMRHLRLTRLARQLRRPWVYPSLHWGISTLLEQSVDLLIALHIVQRNFQYRVLPFSCRLMGEGWWQWQCRRSRRVPRGTGGGRMHDVAFQVRCSNVCLMCELRTGLRRKRRVKLLRAREVGVHVHPRTGAHKDTDFWISGS